MRWIGLVLVAACATQDVLHAQSTVSRALCDSDRFGGGGIAIYGRPGDGGQCASEVVALGDGCYAATPRAARDVWDRHVVECAADAPDGHVMCIDDGARLPLTIGGDESIYSVTLWLNHLPWIAHRNTGRCRSRFRFWFDATLPSRPPPAFTVSAIIVRSRDDSAAPTRYPRARFTATADERTTRDQLTHEALSVTACPTPDGGLAIRDVPSAFAPLAPILLAAYGPQRPTRCQSLEVYLDTVDE